TSRALFFRARSWAHLTLCRSPRPMVFFPPPLLFLWFMADGQLGAALARRVDRVQERGPYPGLLQVADRLDGRATRRGHHLPKLDRVSLGVPEHLRRSEHRLDDELGGYVPRQA